MPMGSVEATDRFGVFPLRSIDILLTDAPGRRYNPTDVACSVHFAKVDASMDVG
jgi:hypothetical protein